MLVDRSPSIGQTDAFIEKYYNDAYITNHQKAEELSRKRLDGKNLLTALGEAIGAYEDSKPLSAAGEPSWPSLMSLLNLMNEVLFNGVLIHKDSLSVSLNSGKNFNNVAKDFLAKLCELCNYNTKKSIDAFEVGAKLNLVEEKQNK